MACIVNGALVQLGLDRVDVVFGAPGKQQWGEGDDREDCTTRDDEVDGRHVGWFNSYEALEGAELILLRTPSP